MMRSLNIFRAVFLLLFMAGTAPPYAQTASHGMSVQVQQAGGVETTVNLYSASYALVIGNDDYRAGWPDLSNAIRDAREIKKALERQGYEVTLLTNLRRDELIQAMREFFIVKGEDPEARLLFWFAGHGYTENNEGFIIPVDGALPETGAKFRLSALPMRDISTFVRLAAAKHVFAVFDACFAGTIFDTSRAAPPKAITLATTRPVRQFLTSGDAFQQVSDDGTFRDLFVRALNGEEDADLNNDGYVTGTELGFYMSDRMTNLTQGRQTPRYGKLRDRNFDQGDYVLAAYQTSAPKTQALNPVASNNSSQGMELVFWQSAEKTDTAQSYREYLKSFPNGVFSGLANERLRLLKGEITKTPPKAPKVQPKKAKPQIAALPPQTSVPTTRLPSSGGSNQWHVTAKVRGTNSCQQVPADFEGEIAVSDNVINGHILNPAGKILTIKGIIIEAKMKLEGNIEWTGAIQYPASPVWEFSMNINEKSPGVYQTTFVTSRNYSDCGLRVTLTLKRNN